jgi:molybdopterin-guanine dinucleotide biosynthesis protein A
MRIRLHEIRIASRAESESQRIAAWWPSSIIVFSETRGWHMVVGGVVLCGGRSERMGQAKALLPFGPESMLQRVVRLLGEAVQPLVVVAAPGQNLPVLPPEVCVVYDRAEGCGPLEGLYCGLRACGRDVDAAFVSGCDTPLIRTAFVHRMIEQLGDFDVAVPREGRFPYPLAGVYRTDVAEKIRELLERRQFRLQDFYGDVSTHFVDVELLRSADPELDSLFNANCPEDYLHALSRAGLESEGGPHSTTSDRGT